jgi:hypothetical protein
MLEKPKYGNFLREHSKNSLEQTRHKWFAFFQIPCLKFQSVLEERKNASAKKQ